MSGIISNASPLILLSAIRELERLQQIFGQVLITPQVYDEVVVRGQGRPGAAEVAAAAFVLRKDLAQVQTASEIRERYRIGLGEASTIALAVEVQADLILIDDRSAREAAAGMGLKVAGTMRVLELAYERKLLPDLRDAYRRLRASSARISPMLLDASLVRFGLEPITGGEAGSS